MKLPNLDELRVDREKIEEYLMNPDHREGGSKAEFFTWFGFRRGRWLELSEALREHGRNHDVLRRVESEHGVRYIVGGELRTPDGRDPRVRCVWILDRYDDGSLSDRARLVTAYPA